MNTQKWRMGNLGLLREADRSMYDGKDTVSKSLIDPTRTHLNYNLCPHPQYSAAQIKEINKRIRGKDKLQKNAIAWGSTIITIPKDYEGDTRAFFEEAYKGLKKMYGLKDEDIISAYVHLDESGAGHMHFYFIPVVRKEGKPDKINWDEVMPRWMYQKQHRILQEYMSEHLGTDVNLLNGKTMDFDPQKLSANQKQASMALAKKREELETINENVISVTMLKGDIESDIASLEAKKKSLEGDIKDLDSTFQRKKAEIEEEINEMPTEESDDEIDLFAMLRDYDKEYKSKIDAEYAPVSMGRESKEMDDELEADEFWER